MTVQNSELAAKAHTRWNGNGKPVALWLDCDTGHDVRFQKSFPLIKSNCPQNTDIYTGCICNSALCSMSGFEIIGNQHYLWQRSSGKDNAEY
jgi:hypothetical protein